MIPPLAIHQDIASSCAMTINRGLDLLNIRDDTPRNLARIVNGSYRFLPYALDFWIDHCLRSAHTAADLDHAMLNRLTLLCNTHARYSSCQVVNLDERNIARVSLVANGLNLFKHTPIYDLMRLSLQTRALTRECGLDSGEGPLGHPPFWN
jgi:hypothetical protein